MRKYLFLLVVGSFLLSSGIISAQDLIIKRDGTEIEAYVEEVTDEIVQYRRYDNPMGPTYKISVDKLVRIEYENNHIDYFNQESSPLPPSPMTVNRSGYYVKDPSKLKDGMRFADLKEIYNKRDYAKLEDPYYGTGRAWMNLLVTGLAQYTMGEPELGTTYLLLGRVAPTALITTGYLIGMDVSSEAGAILLMAGGAMLITFNIISISNAMRVAKIKSLYMHDMNMKKGKPYGFQLSPVLLPAISNTQLGFAPGIGLRFSF